MSSGQSSVDRLEFAVEDTAVRVSACVVQPPTAEFGYVLAHGAGAGMDHPFMEAVALGLAASGVATFRYQFPYMQEGRRRPDPQHLLEATVRSAAREAKQAFHGLELFAGGKSMGGRMTSNAAARESLPGVRGLIFLGFPLHPPGKPGDARGAHLTNVSLPMLFLQGTRDNFANLELLQPIVRQLGVTLHIFEGGDHSFKVLNRVGRTENEVLDELVGTIHAWCRGVLG